MTTTYMYVGSRVENVSNNIKDASHQQFVWYKKNNAWYAIIGHFLLGVGEIILVCQQPDNNPQEISTFGS